MRLNSFQTFKTNRGPILSVFVVHVNILNADDVRMLRKVIA